MNQNHYEESALDQHQGTAQNPYQVGARQGEPDLDANAPYLRSADVQRLNRKALWFLAGIVGLLLIAAIWLFGSATSDGKDAKKPRGEQVVIPAAPKDLPDLPDTSPVAASIAVESALPPLPVLDQSPPPAPVMPSNYGIQSSGIPERRELSLRERRMMDVAGAGGFGGGQDSQVPGMMSPDDYAKMMMQSGTESAQAPVIAAPEGVSAARPLYNANTLMLRGTYIRCVLQSRVITDVNGYTSCIVTEPVYSVNGQRLLLPRGSKVFGSYRSNDIVGERAAIIWDRITTPTGLDVSMSSPGVDSLGSAGNSGQYSAHWGQRIGSALLISLLSDAFKYAGAKHGPQDTAVVNGSVVQSPYESNTARTMERMANMALDKNMSRAPTVTINQGSLLYVYVAKDVDFSAVIR